MFYLMIYLQIKIITNKKTNQSGGQVPPQTPPIMTNYTISERLRLTLENIKYQENRVFWHDLENLEEILGRVQELEQQFEEYQQIMQRIAMDDIKKTNLI